MAREPIRVEIVAVDGHTRQTPDGRWVKDAILAPGSRSEKVQRLGEAALEREDADSAEQRRRDTTGGAMGFFAADENYRAALAALRQHDTEHGRTDGTTE